MTTNQVSAHSPWTMPSGRFKTWLSQILTCRVERNCSIQPNCMNLWYGFLSESQRNCSIQPNCMNLWYGFLSESQPIFLFKLQDCGRWCQAHQMALHVPPMRSNLNGSDEHRCCLGSWYMLLPQNPLMILSSNYARIHIHSHVLPVESSPQIP